MLIHERGKNQPKSNIYNSTLSRSDNKNIWSISNRMDNSVRVDCVTTAIKPNTRLCELNNNSVTNGDDDKGEGITLLWCDNHLEEEQFADDIAMTKSMFHDISNNVQICSSETECKTYLKTSSKVDTIILIVSGSLASKSLLDIANTTRQVDSIFIFCMNTNKYEAFLQNSKVVGIFNDQETLKYNIMKTMRAIERQSAILQLYDGTKQKLGRNLDRETGSFIWLQLVKEVIQKISTNVRDTNSEILNGKEEMLRHCREFYRNNEKEMKNIEEFEKTYSSNQAIKWYTKDSFIFKLINKALRTEDIEVLYKFRFYIVDLCNSLAEKSELLREYRSASVLQVYRGMKHSYEEIERLKSSIGQLISANAFFSASRSKKVAQIYAGVGNNIRTQSDLQSVIFEIEINMEATRPVIVADVSCESQFYDEEEVLFDLGTVFEIESINYDDTNKFWTCSMNTSDKGYHIAQEYIQLERTEMNKADIEIFLGILLFKMGEYQKSIGYFNRLKARRPDDPYILFMLGKAHGVLYQDKQALTYYENAYHLSMNKFPPDLSHAALINTYAGLIYYYECDFDKALSIYTDSLTKYESINMTEQVPFAYVLIGLGYVHYRLSMDISAYHKFQQALKIIQNQTPHNLPDLCRAYRHIATILCQMGNYDQAFDFMKISFDIGKQIFTEKSLAFSIMLDVMGKILYKKQEYEQALVYHLAALQAQKYTFPHENSLMFVNSYNNIGKIFYRTKKYSDALDQYDNAISILTETHFTDHIDTAYTLKNKGELLLAQGDHDNAADYLNRSCKSNSPNKRCKSLWKNVELHSVIISIDTKMFFFLLERA